MSDLNRESFERQGVVVTTWRWEVDATPRLSTRGVQAPLDKQMLLEEAQLVIGVFWKRIGTIGPDGLTGTEHEISRAVDLWSEYRRPNVILYFSQEPASFASEADAVQLQRLLRFRKKWTNEQLSTTIDGPGDFERKFRRHLVAEVTEFTTGDARGGEGAPPRQPPFNLDYYNLPPDFFAQALYEQELARAADGNGRPFWWGRRLETRWFGNLFAFWVKVPGVEAGRVRLRVSGALTPADFRGLPPGYPFPENTPGRQKVALLGMSDFTTDTSPTLDVSLVDFGIKQFVEQNWREFVQDNPDCSAFGIAGYKPIPSLTAVHCVMSTRDGWVVIARRAANRDYFPRSWSISFEEQIDLGTSVDGDFQRDRTILDSMARGVDEEFGVDPAAIEAAEVWCVGRECILAPSGLVINAAVIGHISLNVTIDKVWSCLGDVTKAIDLSENDAWAGVRAASPQQLLEAARQPSASLSLADLADASGVEVDLFPGSLPEAQQGALLWHPTSVARLSLWGLAQTRRRR